MFVILAGALVFGLPTLLLKQFQNPDAVVPRLLRGFGGGVILALALVHIIPSVSVANREPITAQQQQQCHVFHTHVPSSKVLKF